MRAEQHEGAANRHTAEASAEGALQRLRAAHALSDNDHRQRRRWRIARPPAVLLPASKQADSLPDLRAAPGRGKVATGQLHDREHLTPAYPLRVALRFAVATLPRCSRRHPERSVRHSKRNKGGKPWIPTGSFTLTQAEKTAPRLQIGRAS